MTEHHGAIRLEAFNGRVELTLATGGTEDRHEFDLPQGFSLGDVREALAATGMAECQAEECQLLVPVSGGQVRDWLVQMFACFRRPAEPVPRLVLVMDVVGEHPLSGELRPQIPVWAYAWLDIQVRDELADAARTSDAVWEDDELTLDVAHLRDRRIRELIGRYAPASVGRLAPSSRSRPGQSRATG